MTAPPPAETLARVAPGTRLALSPTAVTLHVLAGDATRCGHRTSPAWTTYPDGRGAPCLRLCRRCVAGLPAGVRGQLAPTKAELARVHERAARAAAGDLVALLADLRVEALVDGAAYERTRLVEAQLPAVEVAGRWHHHEARPTRAERDARVTGYIATARELNLLELLNALDPARPDLPGHRVWLGLEAPDPGTPVDVGGTYDPRLWMGRKR